MNVSLTPKLEDFVRRRVASGLYNNASEVIREALRLLIEREAVAGRPQLPGIPSKHELRARLAALEEALRERGVVGIALFGSVVRGEARADSDVGLLVDVDPEAHFSLFDLASLKNFLQEQLGGEVDVVTRQGLEPAVGDNVVREAESVF